MCYNCRDLDNNDPSKTFEGYNININEYQQLCNEVFTDYTNINSSNKPIAENTTASNS